MDCNACAANHEMVQIFMEKNEQMHLQLMANAETIRLLEARLQILGAKYSDMKWQRDALHNVCMNDTLTQRYRQLSDEN